MIFFLSKETYKSHKICYLSFSKTFLRRYYFNRDTQLFSTNSGTASKEGEEEETDMIMTQYLLNGLVECQAQKITTPIFD